MLLHPPHLQGYTPSGKCLSNVGPDRRIFQHVAGVLPNSTKYFAAYGFNMPSKTKVRGEKLWHQSVQLKLVVTAKVGNGLAHPVRIHGQSGLSMGCFEERHRYE